MKSNMKLLFFLVLAGVLVVDHPANAQFFTNLFSNIGIGRTTTTTVTSTVTTTTFSTTTSTYFISSITTTTISAIGTFYTKVTLLSTNTTCTTTTTLIGRVAELEFVDEIATLQPSLQFKQPVDQGVQIDRNTLTP